MSIYVNINNVYTTDGIGANYDPMNWGQFLTLVSGGSTDIETFYLSGTRTLESDTNLLVSANDVTLSAWGETPFRIISTDDWKFTNNADELNVYDGMFDVKDLNIFGQDDYAKIGNIMFDNCYVKLSATSNLNVNYNDNFVFRNSIIIGNEIQVYFIDTLTVYNTIFDIADFKVSNVTTNSVNDSAFTSAISAFTDYSNISFSDIQSQWTRPNLFSSAVSAINASDLSYLGSDFNTLSASLGNRSYTNTWWGGRRDGIGSLYFSPISGVAVSANPTSAGTDDTIQFVLSGNDPFTEFSATSATYNFKDGDTSAVSDNSIIEHQFSAAGVYLPTCIVRSKNDWYDYTTTYTVVTIGNITVTIQIIGPTGNDITSLGQTKPYSNLTFNAVVGGSLSARQYHWDFGDSTTTSATVSSSNHSYNTLGTKTVYVSAYSEAIPYSSAVDTSTLYASATDTLTIATTPASAYYVNITSAYDTNTNNEGTESDPLNWTEFTNYLKTSGEYSDTYYLSGSRELIKPDGVSTPWYPISADHRKRFTINAWDIDNYGPWLISVKDYALSDNAIVKLKGCIIKNGIIYNKPYDVGEYGGEMYLSQLYDMYIVSQGSGSLIYFEPYLNTFSGSDSVPLADSKIKGCTIYFNTMGATFTSAEFSATGDTSFDLVIDDSVVVAADEFVPYSFPDESDVTIRNNVFNDTAESPATNFFTNVVYSDDNQHAWIAPTDYPFTKGNSGYDQNIDWLLSNKKILKPFAGIESPPNPGYGSPEYEDYETGLFGYLRVDYTTSATGLG